MTRPEASEQLSAYLDGELTDAEAAAVEAELSRDPTLREELDELEGVVRFLREEGPSSPSMGFHARVMAAVEAEEAPAASWWAWLRRPFGVPIEGLAVAAAAAAVLLLALPRGGSGPERAEYGDLPEGAEQSPAAVKMPAAAEEDAPAEPAATKAEPEQAPQVATKDGPAPQPPAAPAPAPAASDAPGDNDKVAVKGEIGGEADAPVEAEPTASTGGEAEPRMVAAPHRYDLRTDDPEVKRALLAAIDRVGGTLVSGEATGVMTASREQLRVKLSQDQLSTFDAQLRQLGVSMDRAFDDARLYAVGSEIELDLVLTLEGGPTTPSQAAPPAAKRRATDEMLEAPADEGVDIQE